MPTAPAESAAPSVLSTLNVDGSRRWLRPRPSRGAWWRRRRALAVILIALFTLIPYLRLNGRPVILLDIARREFSLFGGVFYPTDTLLLTLLVVGIFVTVFLLTAVFGRVWCGWACPQTVYMEFLYRPIERFFEGEPGKKTKAGAWRKPAKHAVFFLASCFLAHTFLAYFVGVEQLARWVTQSPFRHPTGFFVMAIVTALMMLDFCFFREQICLVMCPYGRFQSVMLDRNSLIVSYDRRRGEPRGRKARHGARSGDVALPVLNGEAASGDCIDCFKCVTTCPTGIDIRNGLQMECVHCTQCIDACDDVMEKIGRPRGLIRYSSQSTIEGARWRFLRPRVVLYPALLGIVLTVFVAVLVRRESADVQVIRGAGLPFVVLADSGEITNQIKLKVRNRSGADATYLVELPEMPSRVLTAENPLAVRAGALREEPMTVAVSANAFGADGKRQTIIRVTGSDGFVKNVPYRLVGPAGIWEAEGEGGEHE